MIYKANKSKFGKLDGLFRKVILKDREEVCLWCKCRKPCDVAHILDKGRYRKMRYQKNNVLLLCRSCHQRWHDNPLDASKFLAQLLGNDYYDQLKLQDRMIPYTPDMKMLEIAFKQQLTEGRRG